MERQCVRANPSLVILLSLGCVKRPNLSHTPTRCIPVALGGLHGPPGVFGDAVGGHEGKFGGRRVPSPSKSGASEDVALRRRPHMSLGCRHDWHHPAWPVATPTRLQRPSKFASDPIAFDLTVSPMVNLDSLALGFGQLQKKPMQPKPSCGAARQKISGRGVGCKAVQKCPVHSICGPVLLNGRIQIGSGTKRLDGQHRQRFHSLMSVAPRWSR